VWVLKQVLAALEAGPTCRFISWPLRRMSIEHMSLVNFWEVK
jgi:hypothetical protein